MRAEFDTSLNDVHPFYCRGWAAEAVPDVVSPLTATLWFPAWEVAWRRYFIDQSLTIDDPGPATTFTPLVGGRFFSNLSIVQRGGALASVTTAEDMARFFVPPD